MEKKLCLATTALEEFWDKTHPIVFLGEWCRVNQHRYWVKGENCSEVIPYIWNDGERLWKARLNAEAVYEEVLPVLAEWLNTTHEESHEVRYWRIVVGPFLTWYVESLLDRYETLKNAKEIHTNIYTIGMSEDSYKAPTDIAEFLKLAGSSDAWNVQLYTQLADFLGIAVDNRLKYEWGVQNLMPGAGFARIKRNIRILLETISFYLQRWVFTTKADVILTAYWMPIQKRIKVLFHSGLRVAALPYYRNRDIINKVKKDSVTREGLKCIKMDDPFASIVMQTLAYNLPMQYLEAYKTYREESLKVFGRKKVEMVITDIGHFNSKLLPIWLAYNQEAGTKITILQHGGGYGDRAWNLIGKHEQKISDYFFTWGWTESQQTIPVSIFKGTGKEQCDWESNQNILLVCTGVNRFPFGLPSAPMSTQYLDYIDWQCRFLKQLNKHQFNHAVYRKFRASLGWREDEIVLDHFSALKLDNIVDFRTSLMACKVFIGDNMNTTFLEALALNIPTILFWSTRSYESRESAKKYYDRLKEVGIFHDSPEAAANKVNAVYDNVADWWLSKEVQAARQEFCHKFARVIDNEESTLVKTIMKLI